MICLSLPGDLQWKDGKVVGRKRNNIQIELIEPIFFVNTPIVVKQIIDVKKKRLLFEKLYCIHNFSYSIMCVCFLYFDSIQKIEQLHFLLCIFFKLPLFHC